MKTLFSTNGAAEYIRAAEKSIATGDFALALQQIANAKKIDPENEYIQAIVERITSLATSRKPADAPAVNAQVQSASPLAPTISAKEEVIVDDLQARVKRLTNVAMNLFERGSYETAFDSLMKAYLLDPTSTEVMNCEKTLLPAIELMRRRGTIAATAAPQRVAADSEQQTASPGGREDRLEALKRQKEMERKEKERAMWREASKPPSYSLKKQELTRSETETAPQTKTPGGFFSKLRGGKFLG